VHHPDEIGRSTYPAIVANLSPLTPCLQENCRVELGNFLRHGSLRIVESVPARVVLHYTIQIGTDETVISVDKEPCVTTITSCPGGSKVRVDAEKGEAKVGSHALSVSDSQIVTLETPKERGQGTVRQTSYRSRYLHRSEEKTVENGSSHFVTEPVSCGNEVDWSLDLVNTDRADPLLGRGTDKEPIGGTCKMVVNHLVHWCKNIHPLIKNEKWTILTSRKDILVPACQRFIKFRWFFQAETKKLFPPAAPQVVGTRRFRLASSGVRKMIADEAFILLIPIAREEFGYFTLDVKKITGIEGRGRREHVPFPCGTCWGSVRYATRR
jgi:hypothetical protein